jgi:hypothetical protein
VNRRLDFVCLLLSALVALAVLSAAVAPALASPSRAEFEAVRGRYDLGDGRDLHVGGTARRPSVVIGAGPALPLAMARDNRLASPDGRVELRFQVQPNGVVTGVQLTQRP